MPETPSSDDHFADLRSQPPEPDHRTSESPAMASPADGTPSTRREARAAAQRAHDAARVPAANVSPHAAGPATIVPLEDLFAADAGARARDERDRRDRRKSRTAAWLVFGAILALLGGLAAAGFQVWNTYEDDIRGFMGWEEPKDYDAGTATGDVTVTIVTGDTGSSISRTLFESGVTKTADAFYDYLISSAQDPTFLPGVYSLQQQMTSAAALDALLDPANKREDTAQLREGLTVEQSLRLLADGIGLPLGDLEAAVADPSAYGVPADSLEGWLFPATYTFDPEVTASQVIRTLVDRTRTSLDAAGVAVADRQQILTVASIIQREARLEDDFYKVSRVIGNRLADGMKLQMDSTAQFGFDELHDGTASSSAEALADQNPWNTYVVDGLPAGPISNPGDIAIDAAMHPADGNWLYFVTWNMDTGETIFSDTYAEHEKAIAQWDQWCAVNDNRGC